MKKSVKNITFVIRPTEYQDYDILAIGDWRLLAKMSHENKGYDLIRKSKFGGIPILVIDTCDTLKDAFNISRQLE